MNPEPSVLQVSSENGLRTIRLSREHGNAINGALMAALREAYDDAAADDAVRGILLASAGKLFCPGLDLRELSVLDRPAMEEFLLLFQETLLVMHGIGKPVVAAVDGPALAGGCVLALTADWRVLRRGAPIGLNEVKIGVPLPWGVTQILRDSAARSRIEEVALFGRNYADEDAVGAGLAHEIAAASEVEARALERLREFAEKDAAAFATTKRYLRVEVLEKMRERDRTYASEFLDGWFSEGTRKRLAGILAGLSGKKG